ncbi:MAG: hypothetical protein V4471_00750 [Pseudomonadota bacterium]
MDSFDRAFESFKATGWFKLNNAPLTFLQLCNLERYINANLDPNANLNPFDETGYQFHLNNVELIPNNTAESILTGAINEHTIGYHSSLADAHIVRMAKKPQEHISLRITEKEKNLTIQQFELENLLLTLCKKYSWHTIKLNRVKISSRRETYRLLSEGFFSAFFEGLTNHKGALKDFTLAFPSCIELSKFTNFLNTHANLETLHLELGYSHTSFIQGLTGAVAKHPGLKLLDLGNTKLNSVDYQALSGLLDKNYRINLKFSEPDNPALVQLHTELSQRISKPGLERFKEEQLTQAKLVEIAVKALAEGKKERFSRLLNLHSESPAITPHVAIEKVCKKLPAVYSAHADYVKHYASDFQLNLDKPLAQGKSKTVGYHLLEKAFAAEDGESVVHLLKAGANLLERTEQGTTLLSPLSVDFEDIECPDWKKEVISYFQKDLSILIPASRHLAPFKSVYSPLNQIKQLLDRYLTKLRKRAGWPYFLQLISGISSLLQDRKEEWKHALEALANAVDTSTEKGAEINYVAMDVFHQGIKRLVIDADAARRGWLGRSELNDTLKKLGTELINEIEKCKLELHVKEVEQSEQKGSQKQEERIKQLEEKSRLDKKEMEEKLRKQEEKAAEREKNLKEKMEAKAKEQEEKVNQLSQAMEQMKSSFVSNTPNQLQGIISEEKPTKRQKANFCFKH